MLQVFDSWAGELTPIAFKEFSLAYLNQIVDRVKKERSVPMTVFAKGAHYALEWLLCSQYDTISLDYTMDIQHCKSVARQLMAKGIRKRTTFQGNLDPAILFAAPSTVQQHCESVLRAFLVNSETGLLETDIGYICNLGHGIQPETPVENVQIFLETVKRVSEELLKQQK